jgi:lauroyl/myristoyl acyltransferase
MRSQPILQTPPHGHSRVLSSPPDMNQPAGLYGPARTRSQDELRENFFRLLQRSCLIGAKQGQGIAVYRSIARTLHNLCGEPWVHATIFPFETRLVRSFLSETGLPAAKPQSIVQKSLMANAWLAVANTVLQKLNRPDFVSLCTVSGSENLHAARAGGRGVMIAHSHTLFAQLFWCWLEHEGIASGVTTWQWAWGKSRGETQDPRTRALESARELHAAVATLREGGLVHVVADGDKGARETVLPFFNRRRGFRPAFAELAVTTSAPVITVDVTLAVDGGILIEIGKPFTEDSPDDHRTRRVEALVLQYAEHLRERWRSYPADLPWFVMRQQLLLPRA